MLKRIFVLLISFCLLSACALFEKATVAVLTPFAIGYGKIVGYELKSCCENKGKLALKYCSIDGSSKKCLSASHSSSYCCMRIDQDEKFVKLCRQ